MERVLRLDTNARCERAMESISIPFKNAQPLFQIVPCLTKIVGVEDDLRTLPSDLHGEIALCWNQMGAA